MDSNNKIQINVDSDAVQYLDDLALTFKEQHTLSFLHMCQEYHRTALTSMRAAHTDLLKRLFEWEMDPVSKQECNRILNLVIAHEREMSTKRRFIVHKEIRERASIGQLYMDLADLKCDFVAYSGPCDLCNKPIEKVCRYYNEKPIHIKSCTYD